jgi:hydroxyacylglutathione hydrolase
LSFGAAHVPDAVSVWLDGVPRFAGWVLPQDCSVLLVNGTDGPTQVTRYLARLGYDGLVGYLSGGMLDWHMAGKESCSIRMVTVQALCHTLDAGETPWILDVRSDAEVQDAPIPNAQHIHVTQIMERLYEVPRDRAIYVFCGSGMRSMIAASLLQREGWQELVVVLGGLAGWQSTTCPLES